MRDCNFKSKLKMTKGIQKVPPPRCLAVGATIEIPQNIRINYCGCMILS
jgi:hypothetical protein